MVVVVDPTCYIPHILFFCCGAIFFGLFLNALLSEHAEHGWVTSPRMVWFSSLTLSSFVFVLLQVDPYTALGIFPIGWQHFLAWFQTSLLITSVGATLYMFLIILYCRHQLLVPVLITRLYIFANIAANVFVFLISMVGAVTNNSFWFSVTGWAIVIQELAIFFGYTAALTKVDWLLAELERDGLDFKAQRRKLAILRFSTAALCLAAIASQLSGAYTPLRMEWGAPVEPFDVRIFRIELMFGDFLSLIAMLILYYTLRRPKMARVKTTDSPAVAI